MLIEVPIIGVCLITKYQYYCPLLGWKKAYFFNLLCLKFTNVSVHLNRHVDWDQFQVHSGNKKRSLKDKNLIKLSSWSWADEIHLLYVEINCCQTNSRRKYGLLKRATYVYKLKRKLKVKGWWYSYNDILQK